MSNPIYPNAIKQWIDKVDYRDTVLAEHVNSIQAEVTSVERTLGTRILSSEGYIGTFDSATSYWGAESGGLAARVQNIEYGIRGDTHAQYIRKAADSGNVITPTDANTKGLTITPFAGQTADLLVAGNAKIDADGTVYSDGAVVVTTSTTQTLSNKTLSGLNNTFSDISPTAIIVTGTTDIKEYVDAKPQVFYQTTAPATAGVPLGSLWIDSDSNPGTESDIKVQLKSIVAAAATYADFKTAIAAW